MSLKRKLRNLEKNRPKYEIADEAYQNQAIAKARAFGKDRGIQMAEENVDRDTAMALGQAKTISSSTGSLLETLRSITEGGMTTKRGLAMDEAQLQNQRVGELYGANQAMIDEKDKAWNFNVNEPYQLKVQELRERRKARQELGYKLLDMAGTVAGFALAGPAGAAGAKAATGALKSATQMTNARNAQIASMNFQSPKPGFDTPWIK